MNKAWDIPQLPSWGIMQLDKIIPISFFKMMIYLLINLLFIAE